MMNKTRQESAYPEAPSLRGNDANILLVDDDPGAMQLLSSILCGEGNIHFATNGTDAMRIAHATRPDIILLDAEMPGMSGFKVLDALKAEPRLADVPVIFITSHSEAGFEVSALEMGAADYIGKPFKSSIVLARVKTHLTSKRMVDGLRRDSLGDALTGLPNRHHFDQSLAREWLIARRAIEPISLLMIDIDRFKSYNDRYGCPKGDACLRKLSQVFLSVAGHPADVVARCGADEFALLLPKTSREGAQIVGHRTLDAVAAAGIFHRDSETSNHHVTVSIGVASHDDHSPWCQADAAASRVAPRAYPSRDGLDLVLAADRALSDARRAGGARAVFRDISDVGMLELEIDLVGSTPAARRH